VVGRWAPAVLWMAVVFFFSSLSHLGPAARVPDWISHPIEYGVGAALVCRALDGDRRRALTVSTALTATLLKTAVAALSQGIGPCRVQHGCARRCGDRELANRKLRLGLSRCNLVFL